MIILEEFKAGFYRKGIQYKYFVPEKINSQWLWRDAELNGQLEKTAIRLGELNSFSRFVPNIDLFIQLHITKEAVESSRIEGTQTEISEAFMPETEITPENRNDWREVQNYIRAMNMAMTELNTLPLSGRLLKQTHSILMDSVRGEHKMPGAYRTSQNWIGGLSLADAMFIPPHHDLVDELMSDLEHFLHNEEIQIPDLIRIAIAHYQFECIHPFLDGNGRIGRLMITLYLVSRNILDKPLLYLSIFFEKNRQLYFDNLTRVRTDNNMLHWIKYFLIGIEQTAGTAVNSLREVLVLKSNTESLIRTQFGRRTASGIALLQSILNNPVITVERAVYETGLSYKTANDLVSLMVQHSILNEITGQSRNRIFVFDDYLNIFMKY
jgi:Fic family protein